MRTYVIKAIGIDEIGSLWVEPVTARFPFIYREAMQVQWDEGRACLCSPAPREGSYVKWFQQIREAAHRQGTDLIIAPTTSWSNIEADLRQAISGL